MLAEKTLPTMFHLKMSAPMWKTEVEKYIKLSDNTAVEDLSNGSFYIHLCDLIEHTYRCLHGYMHYCIYRVYIFLMVIAKKNII